MVEINLAMRRVNDVLHIINLNSHEPDLHHIILPKLYLSKT